MLGFLREETFEELEAEGQSFTDEDRIVIADEH